MKYLSLSLLFILIISCKTRDDIAREQKVENIAVQLEDSQTISADITSRMQSLEERIALVTGQVEEGDHQMKTSLEGRLAQIEEKMKLQDEQQENRLKELTQLKNQVSKNEKYLKQVLSTLNKISKPQKKNDKNKKLTPYQQGMDYYKRGKYKQAYPILLDLVDKNKIKGEAKARALHNLGMIQYMAKETTESVVFFSRLFTEFPKSGYNKRGLLFLGRGFKKLKKTSEAKQVLEELTKKWPKSKQATEAKKVLKGL